MTATVVAASRSSVLINPAQLPVAWRKGGVCVRYFYGATK